MKLLLCVLTFLIFDSLAHAADFLGATVLDNQAPIEVANSGVSGVVPIIVDIKPDSSAQKMGLKQGDIILSFDFGGAVRADSIVSLASVAKKIQVLRNGQGIDLWLPLANNNPLIPLQPTFSTVNPPILRIETGQHMVSINKISVDKSGKWLVSCSDDKTIRVWDIQSNKLVRIIRPTSGKIVKGNIRDVAISPDGNLIAAGVFQKDGDAAIMIFSRYDGRLLKNMDVIGSEIRHLTFSPNGLLLAAMLDVGGIRIFSVRSEVGKVKEQVINCDLRLIAQDKDYSFRDNLTPSAGIQFSNDNLKLVAAGHDAILRIYKMNTINKMSKESQHIIPSAKIESSGYCVKFSPDGKKIAMGFGFNKIHILSSSDLSLLYAPDTAGLDWKLPASITSVSWSLNGKKLYASGIFNKTGYRQWEESGRGKYNDVSTKNTISELEPLPNGTLAFHTNDSIGIISKNGTEHLLMSLQKGNLLDSLEPYDNRILTSEDGATLKVQHHINSEAKNVCSFSMMPNPSAIIPEISPLYPPDRVSIDIDSIARLDSSEFIIDKAIASDKKSFLLGTYWYLRRFDITGKELWSRSAQGKIKSLNIALNGRVAVVSLGDGTIRWYRYSDGKELVAFFPHADKKRWVLWTPEGFFDHSPGGEELIGFHLNRGKDKEAEFIPVSRLYKDFYRPDLVTASFEGKDISEYANAVDINKLLNVKSLPPKVRIVSKAQSTDKPETELTAEICDNGGGVGDVTLYLNDMPIAVESSGRGLKVVGKNQGAECYNFSRTLTLDNGSNVISIMAYNKANNIESERANVTINHTSRFTGKPNLHILTIAVDKYRDGDLQLKYSRADADGVAELLQGKGAGLFGSITRHTLTDSEVTKEKLEETFASIGKKIRREDMFILFVAGHGITYSKDGAFYFLPVNFRYSQDEDIPKTGVSMNDFKRYLANIQASKSLLLLDTCNSGSFAEAIASRGILEKTAINKLTRAVGRHTIVASSRTQVALEGYEGHGAFSWTLLDGMKGKAANQKGQITVNSLVSFVETALPELTYKKWGFEQIPQKSLVGEDFQIGVK